LRTRAALPEPRPARDLRGRPPPRNRREDGRSAVARGRGVGSLPEFVVKKDPRSPRGARLALRVLGGAAAAALLAACGGNGAGLAAARQPGVAQSSAPLALSQDDATLVAVNTETDTLSIFANAHGDVRRVAELPVGKDPRSVALTMNGLRAFVACSAAGTVDVVDLPIRRIM